MAPSSVRAHVVGRLRVSGFIAGWVVVAAACAMGQGPASTPGSSAPASASQPHALQRIPGRHIAAGPLALDVPGAWYVGSPLYLPSGAATYAYLSPQALAGPCVESASGGVCHGWPVIQLDPGSVVIAIRSNDMPGSSPPAGGEPITVAGHPAHEIRASADESCKAIGGSRSTHVVFPPEMIGGSGWLSIDACIAGPDTTIADAAVAAILASASFPEVVASPS